MTIKKAVENYLKGIIEPTELYSDERKIAKSIIHEIAKIDVEIETGDVLSIYNIEDYVYENGNLTGNIYVNKKSDNPGPVWYYSICYESPFVQLLDQIGEGKVNILKRIDIKNVRCYSKKDVLIFDLMQRYDQYMDNDVFDDTLEFQVKYGLLPKDNYDFLVPEFLSEENMLMKIGHLQEELDEIKKAYANRDLPETADRLMDLIYVAAGLCNLMHLPSYYLWNDVQNSNMAFKERVTSLDNATKRGSTFDVRKTDKWIAPRGKEIIDEWTKQGMQDD